MPPTPDRHPGPLLEEEIQLETQAADPSLDGAIRYVSGAFRLRDSAGVFDARSGGGGITEAQHRALRQLIHFLDDGPAQGFPSGSFAEILPAADPFPTSHIWWETSGKLKKIVELAVTRNANQTPATETWSVYDTDGSTVLATVADAIVYSGVFETSRTRTIS